MIKGTFCMSIDFELLWGRKDLNYKTFIARVKKERKIIKRLLMLFTKYDVPTTWAIVGKLFEEGNALWHAPDVVEKIKKLKNQEIGSHSYSHLEFDKLNTKEADKEIKKCKGVKSFVFPRNKIAHLKLLQKYGFKSYRGAFFSINLPDIIVKPFYTLVLLIDLFTLVPRTTFAQATNGLLNIPGTMYLVSGRGLRKFIPKGLRFLKAKAGIDGAIKENKIFHLWFHPVDFADDTEKLFSDFKKILAYVALKRKEGKLETKTMKQIADEIL